MWIWNISLDTRLLNGRIKKAAEEIAAVKQKSDNLKRYKNETALSLDKFYLKVFNDIKEICFYYNAGCEININNSKDFVDTKEFFKASEYKGIRRVDILCRIDMKSQPDVYLFDMLCRMLKSRPIEILEVNLEKDTLNLTMRLYGT